MNSQILLLLACYAVIALLLLALCVATRWPFWIKTISIVLVGGFFFVTYEAMTGMLGYATVAPLPERFVYHGAVVIQPDKSTSDKGSIFLWASAITADGPTKVPRAYLLPFDKDLFNSVNEAQRRAKEGIAQMGQNNRQLAPKGDGVARYARFLSSLEQKIKLQDLPDPALPEK